MLNVKIYHIGKIRNRSIFAEIDDIKKRISRLDMIELKEIKDKNFEIVRKKEAQVFEKFLDKSCFNVLLWEEGDEFSTDKFYEKFSKIEKDVNFFVTGPFGIDDRFKKEFDMTLSLSKMTFTHEQAIYMLIEQIYRIDCLKKGIKYTK